MDVLSLIPSMYNFIRKTILRGDCVSAYIRSSIIFYDMIFDIANIGGEDEVVNYREL